MFPASPFQMCRYLQYLSEFHSTVDSSKNYVSGVRTLHHLLGLQPPACNDYLYKLTIQGIRRSKAHAVRQSEAMTPELLVQISQK